MFPWWQNRAWDYTLEIKGTQPSLKNKLHMQTDKKNKKIFGHVRKILVLVTSASSQAPEELVHPRNLQ